MAGRTRCDPHVLLELSLCRIRLCLTVSAFCIFYQPFELHVIDTGRPASGIVDLYYAVEAVDEHIPDIFWEILVWSIK